MPAIANGNHRNLTAAPHESCRQAASSLEFPSANSRCRIPKPANVIGRTVARLRYQRGWSQDELVTQLQLLGNINMTRDILANIETLRSPADSKQIEFFAEVFHVREQDLFPRKRHFVGKDLDLELREHTRRRSTAVPPDKEST